jgi:RNA polymerase sigma factor (sigma-70 family)
MQTSGLAMAARADSSPAARVVLQSPLEVAFDLHSRSLYRYFAVRVGGDASAADDLMQQLWLQVCRTPEVRVPREADALEAWLRTIARNLIRERWRRRQRGGREVLLPDPALAAELAEHMRVEALPSEMLERKEVRDQLLLALTELDSADQSLIVGHYFQRRSFEDLAAELSVSSRSVEGRLYRARGRLRARLTELDPEGGPTHA